MVNQEYVVANIINSKNESKSQLTLTVKHNSEVVANIINSKNESKSQQHHQFYNTSISCGKYHKFKERKQITTKRSEKMQLFWLWQIS